MSKILIDTIDMLYRHKAKWGRFPKTVYVSPSEFDRIKHALSKDLVFRNGIGNHRPTLLGVEIVPTLYFK